MRAPSPPDRSAGAAGSGERLQKFLARAGLGSRRVCDALVRQGRVAVNGVPARPGTTVDPGRDRVELDGRPVRAAAPALYLLLHKPAGFLTTLADPRGRPLVTDLLPAGLPRLFPVGRLDFATEGLLLLTNDGAVAQALLHPRFEVPRTYHVKVRGRPAAETLAAFERGLRADGDFLRARRARVLRASAQASWLEVVVGQGRYHEVRRLCEAAGHPVIALRRMAFGPLRLGRLPRGAWRYLTPTEVSALRGLARRAKRA